VCACLCMYVYIHMYDSTTDTHTHTQSACGISVIKGAERYMRSQKSTFNLLIHAQTLMAGATQSQEGGGGGDTGGGSVGDSIKIVTEGAKGP
jgi:hypothetical protein